MTQLPSITVECRHGHSFTTRAQGGTSLHCPICRSAGNQVSVWVSRRRPQTDREARQLADRATLAAVDGQAPELADRWQQEAPWPGHTPLLEGRPGDECGECGGPLRWEPGRTLTYCPACQLAELPAAVAGHYERQQQRSAAVAVRTAPDAAAIRAVRVRLRAMQQRAADRVNDWIGTFDPEGLTGGPLRLALDYRAELDAYLPEIKGAADEGELAEIMAEIMEVTDRARTSGALDELERQREALERRAALAELAELEAREADRAAREESRRAELEARAPRRAIEAPPPAPARPVGVDPGQNAYLTAAVSVAGLIRNRRKEPGSWLPPR